MAFRVMDPGGYGALKAHTDGIVVKMLLIVLLVAMESATMGFASPADVNILNAIATASSLSPQIQVQCKLGNIVPVLSEQTVDYGHRVGFGFKPNVWGTTEYNCDFQWGARTQSFPVWVDDFFLSIWRKRPCLPCLWTVTQDGFFREENGSGDQMFVYYWK